MLILDQLWYYNSGATGTKAPNSGRIRSIGGVFRIDI